MTTEKRLVDANALTEHLTKCIEQSKGLMRSVFVAIKCFVEQMPTVEAVEAVHGRWEREHDGGRFVCSNCRSVKVSYEMLSFFISTGRWKYCPNCGAKMDGERNNK